MNSVSGIRAPASVPTIDASHPSTADLSVAATLLLPSLQHARTQLDVAIRALTHLAQQPPPPVPQNYIETAARIRRVLAESRRAAAHR
jgi:hypothetical protein